MTRDELIAALEAATGQSRELDVQIELFLQPFAFRGKEYPTMVWHAHDKAPQAPLYTASISAALMLVPKGRIWSIGRWGEIAGFVAVLDQERQSHVGATLAIALCIAALRARNELEKSP